jgi:hypothetical protein
VFHTRIGGGFVLDSLSADTREQAAGRVLTELDGILSELAEEGPSVEELAMLDQMRELGRSHPQSILGYVESACERQLLHLPPVSIEEVDHRWSTMTTEGVRDDYRGVLDTLVAVLPLDGTAGDADIDGWTPVEDWASDNVTGTTLTAIDGREHGTVTVGDTGVAWSPEEGKHRTVRWDQLAGCLSWDTGVRHLVGVDGATLVLTPWNWRGGEWLTGIVDHYAPESTRIPMGPGESTYRRDPNDPSSAVNVRWMGSIVGASRGPFRVDLLLHSDGIALLYWRTHHLDAQSRLADMRTKDRSTLLGEHTSNQWIPEQAIVNAKLRRPRLGWRDCCTSS